MYDLEREEYASALDEVQALERLNSVALTLTDQAMFLLVGRTGKKTDTVLPHVLHFVAEFMRPLLDKIDTVHYTQRSRVLKVAEDYAVRLLAPRYDAETSQEIAKHLVNNYSEHGFVLDTNEVRTLLDLATPDDRLKAAIGALEDYLTYNERLLIVGRIIEQAVTT